MNIFLLVFIILLGIVGAILALSKKEKVEKDEYNANEFEIIE